MEPAHITEFASPRYFEKLNALRAAQHGEGHTTEGSILQQPGASSSHYALPLRGLNATEQEESIRQSDQKRSDKARFFQFRHKSHSKSQYSHDADQLERHTWDGESSRQSLPFDQLFECLPNELQLQIIASLPLADILNLRLASRSLHALISLNEATIVRYHLKHNIPAYTKRLYPPPEGGALSLHYYCGIWHRLHVAAKLSDLMCEWITKEIFLRTTAEKRAEFAPQRERMRRRLIPLLFTLFHFFEKYREFHLRYIIENNGVGLLREPYTVNPIEAKIMSVYDDQTLLKVHQVFPLVISSFCRRLRPPSYVGRVEGALRGYLRDKPTDEVHVAILCIGGLRRVERFWEVKGYMTRRAAVDSWYNSVSKDPVETEAKKRRGVLGLGRKKSTAAEGKPPVGESLPMRGASFDEYTSNGNLSLVFNTSLSAGMPMEDLTREQFKMLLSDLPVLQKIWTETAEAVILDRQIVERATDIRRNAQVLLELIREDGMEEEDQWWYGTVAPESVRPDLEAIREDPLE